MASPVRGSSTRAPTHRERESKGGRPERAQNHRARAEPGHEPTRTPAPQPRTSSAAARGRDVADDAARKFQPTTHSRERPRLLQRDLQAGAGEEPFQPTAENVLGCCHQFPHGWNAAENPFQPTAENVLGCCLADHDDAEQHELFQPTAENVLGCCRCVSISSSPSTTFQPTAENVLGCCVASSSSQPVGQVSTHSRERPRLLRRRREPVSLPRCVSTHSRERPRLLRGPQPILLGYRQFQPTAENVLGCCARMTTVPRWLELFQPTAENVLGCCGPESWTALGAIVFQPTAENVLGCCSGQRVPGHHRAGVSTHSRERPRLLPRLQLHAADRHRDVSTHSRERPRLLRENRWPFAAPQPVSTHSRERPRLLLRSRPAAGGTFVFQPTAENVLGCCPIFSPMSETVLPFQPTAENVLGCCLCRAHGPRHARRVSTHSRERPRLLLALLGRLHDHVRVSTHSRERPRLLLRGGSSGSSGPGFQPTAENVLGCCLGVG